MPASLPFAALLCLLYLLPFGLLMRSLCARPHKRHYTRYKTAASAGFVLVALAGSVWRGAPGAFLALAPALAAYLAGDVLLALYNPRHDMRLFVGGAAVFLAGHCWMAGLLAARQLFAWPDAAAALAVALASLAAMGALRPKMPRLFWLGVPVYGAAVALFAAKAVRRALAAGTAGGWLLAAGALLFALSDCIIPLVHFTPRRSLAAHIANLSTYYGGMLLIALSVLYA